MPRIPGNSNAASAFLRSFRTNPAGPPPDKWPAPAILRRWLRRPAFRAALSSLQDTLRLQADFHLATAASCAAALAAPDPAASETAKSKVEILQLLRLSHLRQRFAATAAATTSSDDQPPPREEENEEREITRLDVIFNLHLVEPEMRLNDAELRKVAWLKNYPLPLRDLAEFPPPVPQDTFYYRLIQDPCSLLWFLHLYGERTGDYRHSPITTACKHLMPTERPDSPLPRFRPDSDNNTLPSTRAAGAPEPTTPSPV